jgi:hypothetical protein
MNDKLSDLAILSILKDSKGNSWIGTYRGGLIQNLRNGDSKYYLKDLDVRCIFEDLRGNIWVGTNGSGLYLFDEKNESFSNVGSLIKEDIRAISSGDNNILWLGSYGDGLIRLDTKTNQVGNFNWYDEVEGFNPVVLSMYKSENLIWLGTRSSGLVQFDINSESFSIFDEGTGLANNTVHSIVYEPQTGFWLGTNFGVSLFDNKEQEFINFTQSDGFEARQFNDQSAVVLSTGEIAFGGIHGLNIFNPKQLLRNRTIPSLTFNSIRVSGKSNIKSDTSFNIQLAEKIELDYDQNFFDIDFSLFEYPFNDSWVIEAQLDNFEREWVEVDVK